MRALIVEDGWQRGSLAATRSLGRAGWEVGNRLAATRVRGRIAVRHRVARGSAARRGSRTRSWRRSGKLASTTWSSEPATGKSSSCRSGREELNAVFPYGPHEGVARAFDKVALAEAAQRVGLQVPQRRRGAARRQAPPHDGPGARRLAPPTASRSRRDERGGGGPRRVPRVGRRRGCRAGLRRRRSRRLRGLGRPRSRTSWPRLQQRASVVSAGGGSVRAETVPIDPALVEKVSCAPRRSRVVRHRPGPVPAAVREASPS